MNCKNGSFFGGGEAFRGGTADTKCSCFESLADSAQALGIFRVLASVMLEKEWIGVEQGHLLGLRSSRDCDRLLRLQPAASMGVGTSIAAFNSPEFVGSVMPSGQILKPPL